MNLAASDLNRLLAFAHHLANLSELCILPHFRQPGSIHNKAKDGQFDPVTDADRNAEDVIRSAIAKAYPDHRIIGEEFGVKDGGGNLSWVIDPIDGTKSFITGSPLWGTLIGLTGDDEPLLGLMNQPFTKERFWSDGQQTRYRSPDGTECQVQTRRCPTLDAAMLTTTSPDLLGRGAELDRFDALSRHVLMRQFGGDCYAYCLLAAGHIDLVVEAGLNPHDIVPLIPIVEQAGGQVTCWDGGNAARGGRIVASGDAALHEAALDILGRSP